MSYYYIELKRYQRLSDKLAQIKSQIAKTISQDLLYQIKDKPTTYMQIKTLRDMYAPTTADREYLVQRAYEAARIFHTPRSSIEDWCNDFLTAYNRASVLSLPEAHGFRPHKDFMRAIKLSDSGYASTLSKDIFKAEEAWNLNRSLGIPYEAQLSTLIADFLRYYRTTFSKKPTIHGGAFATLNHEESPYSSTTTTSRKRPRDNRPRRPCLYKDKHY
jgi:hypothetical protein